MKKLLLVFFAGFLAASIPAEVISSPEAHFTVDPPEGWAFLEDPTPNHFVMTDPSHNAVLEIFVQPRQKASLSEKAADFKTKIGAQGEDQAFTYLNSPAWLGDYHFVAGKIPAHGWFFETEVGDQDVSVLAFAPDSRYPAFSDILNSALNSLALGSEGRKSPGPLSAFYLVTGKPPRTADAPLTGLPTPFTLTYNLDTDESVQTVVDRESRLLTPYVGKPNLNAAWSRFYRQLYREVYSSLTPLAEYWKKQDEMGMTLASGLPQTLLTWLQGLEYESKKNLTGLSTPWQVLSEGKGDCDSKAMIYLVLLDQLGYPGILMVSSAYHHAMGAVDLEGSGARFDFGGKKWLVAELTSKVKLGQIAADMADPSQWLGIDLWGKP